MMLGVLASSHKMRKNGTREMAGEEAAGTNGNVFDCCQIFLGLLLNIAFGKD